MSDTIPYGQPAPLGPNDFGSQTQPSLVNFKLKDNPPPSNLYVRQDEFLGVRVINNNAALTSLNIGYKILLANGTILHGQNILPIAAGGTLQVLGFNLPEGYVLSIFVGVTTSTKRGQCWVQLVIMMGGNNSGQQVSMLCQGYVHTVANVAFPQGQTGSYLDGSGTMQTVVVPNPAAGADFTLTVPASKRWRLQSLMAQMTTSVAVANRTAVFRMTDGVNETWRQADVAAMTGGGFYSHTIASGIGGSNNNGGVYGIPLPSPCIMTAGDTLFSNTLGIQAGDQWSNIIARVEELVEF